jgi:GR25 family glycosyltransferase involved in LPS biosynthesis
MTLHTDHLSKQFSENPTPDNGLSLVRHLRCSNLHNINCLVGRYISRLYPTNISIRTEVAISAHYAGRYILSYSLFTKNLTSNLSEDESFYQRYNRHFNISKISHRYTKYPKDIVLSRTTSPSYTPLVTLTITTCKRLDLFKKTMNSFLWCCKDLSRISHFLCVDDNSSQSDVAEMKRLYPFMQFYIKSSNEKGHPQSMNIIRRLVTTPYIFHLEDDFLFFSKRNFISECLDVLGSDDKIGQCLINKNYAETASDIDIAGGHFHKTKAGLRYYIHEYTPDQASQTAFNVKYSCRRSCSYWPHYSFRPSLTKKSVWDRLGEFNEGVSHFEMEYSYRYIKNNYVSAFLEDIYCLHTGRLTSQKDDKSIPNAYDLNNEAQFSGKETLSKNIITPPIPTQKIIFPSNMRIVVANLDNRPERMTAFNATCPIAFSRFSAIHGKRLKKTIQLQQIFENNDYNMRVGLVGCAMTHIKLCVDLVNSNLNMLLIFEDDVTFVDNFTEKLLHTLLLIKDTDWDIVYLGHHLYPYHRDTDPYNKSKFPVVERWDAATSLNKSIGGTFGYLISRKGAEKLLTFINRTGMTNGIDTCQQKAANELEVYYAHPHLVYSECVLPNTTVDSDIQYDFTSLTIPYEERVRLEKEYYGSYIERDTYLDLERSLDEIQLFVPNHQHVIFYTHTDALILDKFYYHKYISYIISDINVPIKTTVIVINPSGKHTRYHDRLKKDGKWDVTDALVY